MLKSPANSPSLALANPSAHYPPLLLREGEVSLGYHPTLEHLVLAGLGMSSPPEAQPGSQVGEGDPLAGDRV